MPTLVVRAARHAAALLRCEGAHAVDAARIPWRALVLLVVVPGSLYGAVMGLSGLRPLQALYSGLKVPLLVAFTTALVLPSSYVLHALLGLRRDFGAAIRGIVAAQGTMTTTLLACAPFTALAYVSTTSYAFAQAFNGLVFLCASLAAQVTLTRHYRALLARNRRHLVTLIAWATLYTFVAIQLAWTLRPFIGRPDIPTAFWRQDPFGNAYTEIAWRMWRLVSQP